MRCEARHDRSGLRQAYDACLATPCVARKLRGISFELFCKALEGFRVLSLYVDGKPAGAAMFRDGDGHIAVIPEYHGRWCTRPVLREIYREWGDNRQATVDEANDVALNFVSRLGLAATSKNKNMVRFEK